MFSAIFEYINLDDQDSDGVRDDIYSAVSLIFWTLTLIALVKYVLVVLKANDTGEGKGKAFAWRTETNETPCLITCPCACMNCRGHSGALCPALSHHGVLTLWDPCQEGPRASAQNEERWVNGLQLVRGCRSVCRVTFS